MSEPVFTGGIPQHRAKLYRCLFCRVEPDLRKQEESGQGLVLDLRQCFREFSLEAYPELVVLVWPEYARPEVDPDNV